MRRNREEVERLFTTLRFKAAKIPHFPGKITKTAGTSRSRFQIAKKRYQIRQREDRH